MFKRGQISIEYLVVVGFVVFLVISILGFAFFYSSNIRDRIRVNQATGFANKLISASESVYYSGEPSKITIRTYLPSGVKNIDVLDDSLIIGIITNSGLTTMAFSSNVPINGSISVAEGVKNIEVVAKEDGVEFSD